ncbi:protein of unknown function [Thauera humireducens]|nr:protein of unknown function [Thauera humireducens]
MNGGITCLYKGSNPVSLRSLFLTHV